MHLAAADPQLDVAVGDDAGEALGDPAQLDRVRARPSGSAGARRRCLLLRPWWASPSGAAAGCAAHVVVCIGGDGIDRRHRLVRRGAAPSAARCRSPHPMSPRARPVRDAVRRPAPTRRRARAACARARRRVDRGARARRSGPATDHGVGRDLDLAVDDLLTVVVDLALDVVDEAAGGGQADAVGRQVVDDVRAALDAAVDEVVDVGLDGVVDPLEHRRHDHGLQGRVVDGVVLVGVDTDRALARGGSRLEHAEAGAAGRVVDDVGAGVVHALRDDLALGRVVEPGEVTVGRDVLTVDR